MSQETMETQLLHTLHNVTQKTTTPRGVVLPLYDDLVALGLSLIMELRALGVTLPVEIPHCGDLDLKLVKTIKKKTKQLGQVIVYDACELAVKEKSLLDSNKPIFCKDIKECHDKFRTFDIKVLGVIYSRFEEVMLVDADALMMQNPMPLWETEKFQKSGTLFFNDRISQTNTSLGFHALLFQSPMALWNTQKYQTTGTMFFNDRIAEANFSMGLGYKPANRPNIMAIEDYLSKADLAETKYTFSDFATGSAGGDFRNKGENKSIICGSAAHYFPEKSEDTPIQKVSLLYMNTDYIMRYKPKKSPMYYSAPRPRDFFPGTFEERKLLMMCPFDITGVKFSDAEVQQIYQRQHFFDIAKEWEDDAKEPAGAEREAAEILTNEKLEVLLDRMKNGPPLEDATDPPKDPFKEEQEKKSADIKNKADELREQEKQLVHTLNQIAQQTTVKRGIVIPVYDGIIKLAISLVLELRTWGINEPIEMPHCGDLNPEVQKMYPTKQQLGTIWFYNVCEKAARATSVMDSSRKVFCDKLEDCHKKFRGFIIKPLSVTFSRFEEIMMIDADTTFFVNPAKLWDSEKYNKTGNFLMHDRISHEQWFMAERVPGKPDLSVEQNYFSTFDVKPFREIPTLERPKATIENPTTVTLNFEPSEFLLRSHSFNIRAGHQVDSSLVLWNKKRQPRATAIAE
ncbi:hypothetical protein PHMEG_0008556 [Phytophthora megakarya]|uniref:Nucleotide-diphospho-sugar transferase domain-containing protein n=1 Tax=Phytophthora megakarya TaxID=4795 RepID=A0A225WKH7_9STRA|nr:hypothetical protein PHMEG_0008556 [Phytophthora megakarya]